MKGRILLLFGFFLSEVLTLVFIVSMFLIAALLIWSVEGLPPAEAYRRWMYSWTLILGALAWFVFGYIPKFRQETMKGQVELKGLDYRSNGAPDLSQNVMNPNWHQPEIDGGLRIEEMQQIEAAQKLNERAVQAVMDRDDVRIDAYISARGVRLRAVLEQPDPWGEC